MLPIRAGPFEITGGGVSIPPQNKSYALEKIPADKRALKKKIHVPKIFHPHSGYFEWSGPNRKHDLISKAVNSNAKTTIIAYWRWSIEEYPKDKDLTRR